MSLFCKKCNTEIEDLSLLQDAFESGFRSAIPIEEVSEEGLDDVVASMWESWAEENIFGEGFKGFRKRKGI